MYIFILMLGIWIGTLLENQRKKNKKDGLL